MTSRALVIRVAIEVRRSDNHSSSEEMSKTEKLELLLLRQRPVYLPGEWIEGVVRVRLNHSLKARALRLKFFGVEHTFWVEHHGNNNTQVITETRKIVKSRLTLWGYPKGAADHSADLPSGSYIYPFAVQVPVEDNLPATWGTPSFKNCHVTYGVTAYFDIARAADLERTCRVVVIPRLSVAICPELSIPIEDTRVGIVGCACCPTGNVQARVRLLQQGLHSDGQAFCVAEIVNNSRKNLRGVHMQLFTNAICYAHGREHRIRHKLITVHHPLRLAAGETFSNMEIALPATRVEYSEQIHGDARVFFASQPFYMSVPRVPSPMVPDFEGQIVKIFHRLVFKVAIDDPCTLDVRVHFEPRIITQDSFDPLALVPTVLNPTGQPRTSFLPDSKTPHHANFSFDGLDYRAEDQLDLSKMVAYPSFHDSDSHVVPHSVNSYSSELYQELTNALPAAGATNFAFASNAAGSPTTDVVDTQPVSYNELKYLASNKQEPSGPPPAYEEVVDN